MIVWLDDVRPMPEGFTHWAKTADEAIALLATGRVEMISLDHDLYPEHYLLLDYQLRNSTSTGYDVACWIEEAVLSGKISCAPQWSCHSMNPSGKLRIEAALSRWNEKKVETQNG